MSPAREKIGGRWMLIYRFLKISTRHKVTVVINLKYLFWIDHEVVFSMLHHINIREEIYLNTVMCPMCVLCLNICINFGLSCGPRKRGFKNAPEHCVGRDLTIPRCWAWLKNIFFNCLKVPKLRNNADLVERVCFCFLMVSLFLYYHGNPS